MCEVSPMDFCVVAVSALLLFSLDSIKAFETSSTTPNSTNFSAPTSQPAASTRSSVLRLGFLTINWGFDCAGSVMLTQLDNEATKNVCYSSKRKVEALLSGVCEGRKGCRGDGTLQQSENISAGVLIYESNLKETHCPTLIIKCQKQEERPPVEPQEPVGFKVATALLCVSLILLLLFCFSKPTIRALQKRLSNKRKNRWIGPTQSHSVSYHRGQTVNKNMDGQKHSSYPALDRLTVGNREPSSNRNSYNF